METENTLKPLLQLEKWKNQQHQLWKPEFICISLSQSRKHLVTICTWFGCVNKNIILSPYVGLFSSDCSDIIENKKGHVAESPSISQVQHIFPTWLALPNANEENVNGLAVTAGSDYTNKRRLVTKPKYFRSYFRPQTASDCFLDCLTHPKKLSKQIPTQLLPKRKIPSNTVCFN